jgi:phosphate starvation-inducible protein PhoH and related proteins
MSKNKKPRKAVPLDGVEQSVGSSPQKSSDHSPHVYQREKIKFDLNIRCRNDLTDKQKQIIETMLAKDTRCVFIDGIYGSAKTWTAMLAALQLLDKGKADQLVYIRNPIESSSSGKVGFIPGDLSAKMAPYAAPMWDKLDELLCSGDINKLEKDGRIEAIPVGFIRGRSWGCKVVIVDEASSMTWDDLILILTRCGEFTRIFFIGDSLNQNDLGAKSGFRKMFDTFNDEDSRANGVHAFELRDQVDIVRSSLLRFAMRKLGILKSNDIKPPV